MCFKRFPRFQRDLTVGTDLAGTLLIRQWLKRSRVSSNGCAQVKISGYGVIPCCIILANPIREIEGGKEIQEGKTRSPGAQEEGDEEGDEEGEAGQESKG